MFRLVDSRTLLLLVATHCVLLSLVRCQQEDDRKLEFFTLKFKVFCFKKLYVCCHGDVRGKFGMDQFGLHVSSLDCGMSLARLLNITPHACILSLSLQITKV